jgi:hypothetical protein
VRKFLKRNAIIIFVALHQCGPIYGRTLRRKIVVPQAGAFEARVKKTPNWLNLRQALAVFQAIRAGGPKAGC